MLDRFETAVIVLDSLRLSLREDGDDDGWMIGSAIVAEDRIGSDLRRQTEEADPLRSRNQRGKGSRGYSVRGAATFVPRISGLKANFAAIGQTKSIRRTRTEAR